MTQPVSPFLAPTPAPAAPPDAAPAPAAAPQPLIGVETTNQIAPEELTDAYRQGLLQFREDEKVPVRLSDGRIGRVPAASASDVVNQGGEIIPHAVVEHERLAKEYGGAGGTFGAGLAGLARGVSVGLSDPIAIAAAEVTGGGDAAAKMRERLNAYKELSPVASAVGEITGMVAPALLSGGETALARGAALLPSELATGAGRLAERGVAAIIPEMGESLLARTATRSLTGAAEGALTNAIFAGGQEISENALGDTNLTGEKLLAAMGHGAVIGGMLGGALGGGAEIASDALTNVAAKASPYLSRQAGVQAWKSLDPIKKFTKEAEARFEGGSAGVGRVLLDTGVIPKDAGLMGAALTPEELLPRVEERLSAEGKKIGKILDESPATVRMGDLAAQIEETIAPLRGKAGFKPIVAKLEDYRNDLFERLGGAVEDAKVSRGEASVRLEIPDSLKHIPREKIEEVATAAAGGAPEAMQLLDSWGVKRIPIPAEEVVSGGVSGLDILSKRVPVKALFEQKRALGDLVYKEVKALDPNMRVEHLREAYGRMSKLEAKAIADAAKEAGGATGAELLAARRNYQGLSIAKNALDETSARMATNRNLGMSEYLTAGMAAASGHLLAAPVVAAAHKVARARGNAFLAATFDKLSALQAVSKRVGEVDATINRGVKALVKRSKGELPRAPEVAAVGSESAREEFDRRVADVQNAAGTDHGAAVTALAPHAPGTASRFASAATAASAWLATQVPKAPPIGSRSPAPDDVHRFLLQARAVDDPAGTIARGLATGRLSATETHAIRDCGAYPNLLAEIQRRIVIEASRTSASPAVKSLPYGVRRDLALLFDAPEWSMSPEGLKTLQANAAPSPSPPKGPGASPRRPIPTHPEMMQSETERLALR